MPLSIAPEGIEIGIVTRNAAPMVEFYRDLLGLEFERELTMGNGVYMTRLKCGPNIIKILVNPEDPPAAAPPGGAAGATGYRYWTIPVTNIDEAINECKATGADIPVPVTDIGNGISIAMVADPDGNWVNLLQRT
jgi:glyoxylase I family protein